MIKKQKTKSFFFRELANLGELRGWRGYYMACWAKRRGWGVPLFLAVGQMHMGSHVTRGLTG
jgi:hypothetical protein